MSSRPNLHRLASRVWLPGLAATLALAQSNLAQAQEVDEFGMYGDAKLGPAGESGQAFSLEIRLGPYLPRVDSEFDNGDTPFERYYGKKNRIALGMEFDWLPLELKDTLRFGPGVGLMYTSVGADAFRHDDGERAAGQTTSLRMLPHWVVGVLRIDALARRTPIPLVLAAKAGFAHSLWWTSDEPRNSPAYDGTMGRGRSYGAYYGAGVYLDFSFLDTQRRKRLDSFLGINRIYFFGELYALELDGFGASGVMNVGDRSWVLGMAFDL